MLILKSESCQSDLTLLETTSKRNQVLRPSMLCTETETVRKPGHHDGGEDHGGGSKRNPVLGVILLVACIYPFRCVVRTSVHSEIRALNIPFYLRPVYRL